MEPHGQLIITSVGIQHARLSSQSDYPAQLCVCVKSIFNKTDNHASGEERRVPIMVHMVEELSSTSVRSVCDDSAHTGQQYSIPIWAKKFRFDSRYLIDKFAACTLIFKL